MQITNRFALGFGALYLVVGLCCLIGGTVRLVHDFDVARHGERAIGQVVTKYHAVAIDGARTPFVDYWFTLPGGQRIKASQPVSDSKWQAFEPGMSITVVYSPQNPAHSYPQAGSLGPIATLLFVCLSGVGFLFASGMLLADSFGRPSGFADGDHVVLGH